MINNKLHILKISLFLIVSVFVFKAGTVLSDDVFNTKHNLSANGPLDRNVKSDTDEVCVFCHTPHNANPDTPLWNRYFNPGNYSTYNSPSMDAIVERPSGYSKLCLSCHDGTFAISELRNLPGPGSSNTITMIDAAPDESMRYGTNNNFNDQFSGDTRRIGSDLTNDHPISFKFDEEVVFKDGELIRPYIISKKEWSNAEVRLYPQGFSGNFPTDYTYVQCTSCHNPHSSKYTKFLRAPKYNTSLGSNDQICFSCHIKTGWVGSTHERTNITFNDGSLDEVGKRACLSCHDTHTEHGAERLLREGASNPPGSGSSSAMENTCFQCHTTIAKSILAPPYAPDIKSEFDKFDINTPLNAMPLSSNWDASYAANSSNGTHAPVFVSPLTLGREAIEFNPNDSRKIAEPGPFNVHVECVDCHNPHQVRPGSNTPGDFDGGRLTGMPGIDINGNEVGFNTINSRNIYIMEICFRCHGNSFDKVMQFPFNGTSQHKRPFTNTNKRLEFDPNADDVLFGPPFNPSQPNSAFHPVAAPGRNTTRALCEQLRLGGFPELNCSGGNYKTSLGNLTINCTDCHNSEATNALNSGPVTESSLRITDVPSKMLFGESVIGPHGSIHNTPNLFLDAGVFENNDRSILRGYYYTGNLKISDSDCVAALFTKCNGEFKRYELKDTVDAIEVQNRFKLCFNCHDFNTFYDLKNKNTNFYQFIRFQYNIDPPRFFTFEQNLHAVHVSYRGEACMSCHYNVHSNVQAVNTDYIHPNSGTIIPDGDTHLINFAPDKVKGNQFLNPVWGYSGQNISGETLMGCNLKCHDKGMGWNYPCKHCLDGGPVSSCAVDRISDTCCDCDGCCVIP